MFACKSFKHSTFLSVDVNLRPVIISDTMMIKSVPKYKGQWHQDKKVSAKALNLGFFDFSPYF